MVKARIGMLAIALSLAACQAVGPASTPEDPLVRKSDRPSTRPGDSPRPQSTPAAGVSPAVAASTTVSAAPAAAPTVLKKPAGATRLLAGQVEIDAYYASTVGGGRIVSNGGAQAIAFGGATVIGNNGGNIISDNGGGLIGKVKAPIPGVLSNNAAGYRVAQAAALALGETLPAAGLALQVFSLRTGAILPLGENGAGQPVYEVYSDARGEYQLYLPEGELNNLLLVANVPGAADARLDYSLLVPQQDARQTMDEDTSLVSDFLRQAFTDNMEADLKLFKRTPDLEAAINDNHEGYGAAYQAVRAATRRKLFTAAEAAGVRQYDATRLRILANRVTDTALSHMKLLEIRTDYATEALTRADEPAVPALGRLLRAMREMFRTHMRELVAAGKDIKTEYDASPLLIAVNQKTTPPFVIKTPGDAVVFMVRGLINNPQMEPAETRALMLEAQTNPAYRVPPGALAEMYAATKPLQKTYIQTFYLNEAAGRDAIAAITAGVEAP